MNISRSPPIWNFFAWLVALTILFATESAAFTYLGHEIPLTTESLWAASFGLLSAWGVHTDRRSRAFGAPFEFDAFVIFAWPILVPYYLYRTRGRIGLGLGACVWLLYLFPYVVAWVVYLAFKIE